MPIEGTPTQRLAAILLGESLEDWTLRRRSTEPPTPWRHIARDLHEATAGQVDVTEQTLRMWYVEPERAAS